MVSTKAARKKPVNKSSKRRRVGSGNVFNDSDPTHVALPDEETRQLVLQIIAREGVAPFVRRMVILMDGLRAGQSGKLAQVARASRDPAYRALMSALTTAVREGREFAAYETAFYAAHCASITASIISVS